MRCHNTWREVSRPATTTLEQADHYGSFYGHSSIAMNDFLPNNLVALIFDLEFRADVQGHPQASICLGYQVHMASLNTVGQPDSQDIELKLTKGPGESYRDELLISEEATTEDSNVFDLVLRGHITTNQVAPDPPLVPGMMP